MTTDMVHIGILGASGYTGAELVRLLAGHPRARVAFMTAERHAGKELAEVFPHLGGLRLPRLAKLDDGDFGRLDVVFACLPHATTQQVIRDPPPNASSTSSGRGSKEPPGTSNDPSRAPAGLRADGSLL